MTRAWIVVAAVAAAFGVHACASDAAPERVAQRRSAILAGRPSGEGENAAVLIETRAESNTIFRCSGHVVAPRLVLTVRHCLLRERAETFHCQPDGSPTDLGADQSLEPPERITIHVGEHRSALRPVRVSQVLTTLEVSICRSDIAFLVLAEDALAARTPLHRAPVRIGDRISVTGWGYTGDDQSDLPAERSTLDALRVSDVGPGFIPAGTFSITGSSLCLGDSGAAALSNGAVVGTYSRMTADRCALADAQHVLTGIANEQRLIQRAFDAIGERPSFDDDPVGGDAGSTCDEDAAPCADRGSAASGCGLAHGRPERAWISLAALVVLSRRRRRRRAHMHFRKEPEAWSVA